MYQTTLAKPEVLAGTALTFRSPAFEPVRYVIHCLPARGPDGRVQNWSLKQLNEGGFQSLLRETLPDEDRTYYAPTVNAMSGVVLPHKQFTIICELDRYRRIRRPGYLGNENERVPCDGTIVGRSDGFIMAAGGCPLVALSDTSSDMCLVAHAGRNSLIDPFLLRKGRPSRAHESVIDAMAAYARKHFGADPKHLILRSFFSLPWQTFPHDPQDPTHGSTNVRLRAYLAERGWDQALIENETGTHCLSLSVLIKRQAERHGIGHSDVGLLELPVDGDFAYTRHALPELGGAVRNLVLLRRL